MNPEKQWGGKREGGGFQPKWKSGNSKPLRIPESLHEAVLIYAHELDDRQSPEAIAPADPQGIIQPANEHETASAEEIRQMRLTLEALNIIMKRWREELRKHNPKSPRWEKANQLFDELEVHLTTPWL